MSVAGDVAETAVLPLGEEILETLTAQLVVRRDPIAEDQLHRRIVLPLAAEEGDETFRIHLAIVLAGRLDPQEVLATEAGIVEAFPEVLLDALVVRHALDIHFDVAFQAERVVPLL